MKRASLIVSLFIVGFIYGCSDYYIEDVERGGGYNYISGFPELRLVTAGYFNEEGIPIIDVSGDVVYAGLIYTQNNNDQLQANISIDITITEKESEEVKEQITIADSLIGEGNNIVYSQDVYRFSRKFEISPGTFDIEVVLTDTKSGKQTKRKNTTTIPDFSESVVSISEIQILGKDSKEKQSDFIPITTYDVPGNLDSLKFIVQLTNSRKEELEINSRLKKFVSDTTIAWPMSIQNYPQSSIRYQGIEYDEFSLVQSSSRIIQQQGNIFIEYSFGELNEGNYRLEIEAMDREGGNVIAGREFGIKPPYYPAVRTTEKMAESLRYIMADDEYEALMSIKDKGKDSLKHAVDRFWLRNINNSALAKDVISMYYNRVEEANKQFSNYKEGWKTDLGMVYILFGPPWSVNDVFNYRMIWSYTNNLDDPERNFLFRVSDIKSKYFPFDNYILDREIEYYSLEYKQKQRWRTGSILTVDL